MSDLGFRTNKLAREWKVMRKRLSQDKTDDKFSKMTWLTFVEHHQPPHISYMKSASPKPSYLPHVDQILSKCDGVVGTGNGYSSIWRTAFTIVAVWNANHGPRYLSNLSYFGASLANDTTNQFIWNSHFCGMLIGVLLVSRAIRSAKLRSRQCSQC